MKIFMLFILISLSAQAVPLIPFIAPKNNAAEAPDINIQKEMPKDGLRRPQPLRTLKEGDFGNEVESKEENEEIRKNLEIENN